MPPESRSVPRSSRVRSVIDAHRFADVEKHALTELNQALGRRRHAHLAPDAQEQRLAQLLFEQQDLAADGGLRHVQLPPARRERAGLGDGLEDFELSQIHGVMAKDMADGIRRTRRHHRAMPSVI